MYYSKEAHRSEFRILLLPGSYVPQSRFESPAEGVPMSNAVLGASSLTSDPEPASIEKVINALPLPEVSDSQSELSAGSGIWWRPRRMVVLPLAGLLLLGLSWTGFRLLHQPETPQHQFWAPLLHTNGPILIVVGSVPKGPPLTLGTSATTIPVPPLLPPPRRSCPLLTRSPSPA